MNFKLDKSALADCLLRLKDKTVNEVLADEEFIFFHKYRNSFNDIKATRLEQIAPYDHLTPKFRDNLNRIWVEETLGIKYHVDDWFENLTKWGKEKKNRESRKFLLACPLPNYDGCTHEMVITKSGFRDTRTHKMETFNFGRSVARESISGAVFGLQVIDPGLHYKFDMASHDRFNGYTAYVPYSKEPPPVRIIDVSDLIESGRLKKENI